jgi:general secretion pathway protein J
MNRPQDAQAGFSLVEMLVALAVLSLAALMMTQGFVSGRRLWADQQGRTYAGETVQSAQSLLRDRIERLRPVTRLEGGQPHVDVEGAPDSLVFLSLAADAQRPAPLRRYRLALDDRGDLVFSDPAAPDTPDQVLVRRVDGLAIDYFGVARPGDAPGWQSDWRERPSPPQLVRIRIAFPAGDRRVWPDLIVAPAAPLDTLCVINAATGGCRGRA